MPGRLQRFLPREEGFFDLFAKQAANIHEGANALLKMLTHYTGVPQVQIVKAFEHEGDEITHAIFTKLNQTFMGHHAPYRLRLGLHYSRRRTLRRHFLQGPAPRAALGGAWTRFLLCSCVAMIHACVTEDWARRHVRACL